MVYLWRVDIQEVAEAPGEAADDIGVTDSVASMRHALGDPLPGQRHAWKGQIQDSTRQPSRRRRLTSRK